MRRPGAVAQRGARRPREGQLGEHGFSLVEVLAALTIATLLFGVVLSLLVSSQRIEDRDSEWALTLQEDRAGLARIVREVRQAYSVKGATGNSIDFLATIGGKNLEIYYQCNVEQPGTAYDRCVRVQATPPASLPALSTGRTIVSDVLNQTSADPSDPVFSYSPNAITPSVVALKVVAPSGGTLKLPSGSTGYTHKIVLSNSAYIRAMNLGA